MITRKQQHLYRSSVVLWLLTLSLTPMMWACKASQAGPENNIMTPASKEPEPLMMGKRLKKAGVKSFVYVSELWARIYVDDNLVGLSAYLPSGKVGYSFWNTKSTVKIRIEKKGFVTQQRQLTLKKGKVHFFFKLQKKAAAVSTKTEDLPKALQTLQASVTKDPGNWKLHKQFHQALKKLVNKGSKSKRERFRGLALAHLKKWRKWSPRSQYLLKEQYHLMVKKDAKKARQLLSEWTEHSPTNRNTWQSYGRFLESVGLYGKSCDAYNHVIHLDPSATTLFQGMMGFRRKREVQPHLVEDCIVKGVRKMPIERKLTILMMWDQDGTDIDMWVTEPKRSVVSYKKRQSVNGGVLYYDVTKGFGPEIYVNAQKKGRYRLSAVYFAGGAPKVKVRFIVMLGAGTEAEQLKEYTLTLHKRDQQRKAKQKLPHGAMGRHVAWIDVP